MNLMALMNRKIYRVRAVGDSTIIQPVLPALLINMR